MGGTLPMVETAPPGARGLGVLRTSRCVEDSRGISEGVPRSWSLRQGRAVFGFHLRGSGVSHSRSTSRKTEPP